MSPVERAKRIYDLEPCARTFVEDLELHLLNGYVFSTPDFFIMGRAVIKDSDPTLIVNPAHRFPERLCDTWLVYLASGDGLKGFFRFEPFPLPWIAWERRNRLRYYRRGDIGAKARAEEPHKCKHNLLAMSISSTEHSGT